MGIRPGMCLMMAAIGKDPPIDSDWYELPIKPPEWADDHIDDLGVLWEKIKGTNHERYLFALISLMKLDLKASDRPYILGDLFVP